MARRSSMFDGQTPRKESLSASGRLPSLTPASKHLPPGRTIKNKFSQVGEVHRRPETLKTPLHINELNMAEEMWNGTVTGGFVTSLPQLNTLLSALQIPQQPIITNLVKEKFAERSHFSYQDFLFLLEQCKTIHIRWLHKIQGKSLDDDLLEAFVAVGGEEDSGGEVDLDQMRNVISEFHLTVDLDRIVPGGAKDQQQKDSKNLHFGGFAQLLKDQHIRKNGTLPPLKGSAIHGDTDLMLDDIASPSGGMSTTGGSTPPLLSTMEFFEEDIEVGADGIVRHRAPEKMEGSLAGGWRMVRQASNLAKQISTMKQNGHAGPLGDVKSTTPEHGHSRNKAGKKQRQFGGTSRLRSPPRSKSTEPLSSTAKASGSPTKLQPIRQINRGPKKPKYANW